MTTTTSKARKSPAPRKGSKVVTTSATPKPAAKVTATGDRDYAVQVTTEARTAGRQATILQATAVSYVDRHNLVGKAEGAVWPTWEAYGLALGVTAKSSVSRLRTLARGLTLGLVPDSKVDSRAWSILSDRATDKNVRAVVMAARTRKEAREGIIAASKANPKATTNPGAGDKGTDGKGGATPAPKSPASEQGPAMPQGNPARLDLIETLLAALDVKGMTRAEHKRLAGIVERAETLADAWSAAQPAPKARKTA